MDTFTPVRFSIAKRTFYITLSFPDADSFLLQVWDGSHLWEGHRTSALIKFILAWQFSMLYPIASFSSGAISARQSDVFFLRCTKVAGDALTDIIPSGMAKAEYFDLLRDAFKEQDLQGKRYTYVIARHATVKADAVVRAQDWRPILGLCSSVNIIGILLLTYA